MINKLKNRIAAEILSVLFIVFFSLNASAAVISFSPLLISGNQWRYNYTITAEVRDLRIDEFTIYFSPTLYSNLVVENSPTGWDAIVIQPDASIPSDGFFDVLALNGGINPGSTQGGFATSFIFLGSGTPSIQRFEIVDPNTFLNLSSGFTSATITPTPPTLPPPQNSDVPEPNTLALSGFALILLLFSRKHFTRTL